MISRLLFAIDQFDVDRHALEAAAEFAHSSHAEVRVVHVREGDYVPVQRYLETSKEAWTCVEQAVFELRMASIGASGQVLQAPVGHVAQAIEDEARAWGADAILLGPGKTSGFGRIFARPVRSRLDRISRLPVIAVPPSFRRATVTLGEQTAPRST